MVTIEKIDTHNKTQVKRFVDLPYHLYKNCPHWVPPLYIDAYLPLKRKNHAFFAHSAADFFLAMRDGEGRSEKPVRVEYKNHRVYRKILG